MWILTTVYSTDEWGGDAAGFLIEVDNEFVQAMAGINLAVRRAAEEYRTRISYVDIPLSMYRWFLLDRDTHEVEVCDLLGLDELPNFIEDGAYAIFAECPLFLDTIKEADFDDYFSARLDNGLLQFVSLSGDPELSTPEIPLKELEAVK